MHISGASQINSYISSHSKGQSLCCSGNASGSFAQEKLGKILYLYGLEAVK